MDHHLRTLIAAALCALAAPAFAGYAQAKPPPNWTPAPATAPAWSDSARATFRAAANESWSAASTVRTNAALNVAGQEIKLGAQFARAANAGKFAGRFAGMNPMAFAAAFGGALAVDLLVDYFKDNGGLEWVDGHWKKLTQQIVCQPLGSQCGFVVYNSGVFGTREGACNHAATLNYGWAGGAYGVLINNGKFCQVYAGGSYRNAWGVGGVGSWTNETIKMPANYPSDFDSLPDPSPAVADAFDKHLGPQWTGWEVGDPVLNPNTATPPVAQPYLVPVGDPVPLPNTNPQTYSQPLVKVVPSPIAGNPWRVDQQPITETGTNPTGVTSPGSAPSTPPAGSTTAPRTQEEIDLCKANPEILACANLDQPDDTELQTREVPIAITPDTGWGGAGSCPTSRSVQVSGINFELPFSLFCDFMNGVRPIIIAFAWLAAASMLIMAVKKS